MQMQTKGFQPTFHTYIGREGSMLGSHLGASSFAYCTDIVTWLLCRQHHNVHQYSAAQMEEDTDHEDTSYGARPPHQGCV
eukprot:NODE_5744_length_554_cov_123.772277_g5006_i0.p2 GENE.NODE_5744_length_554_cov_123.772277_g5006_i0~~NODE_5744_length_554_cov_123.772277_g5006_i0.p2  ORF type:complete len:80 (-),score=4.27 NODE_5744_length_554_cov_123.772277_g5006_i0:277-516(-)